MNPLHRVAKLQHGVVTRTQVLDAGITSHGIDRRLAAGDFERLFAGVYLLAGHPVTPAVRLRAAVFGAGTGAVAWGPSAAWWTGLLDRTPHGIWITVPAARRPRGCVGTIRRRDLHSEDVCTSHGLRLTAVDLTVLETASLMATSSLSAGMTFLDRALQTSTSLDRLHAAHQRNVGRTGSALAASMLARVADGAESEAERVFVRLLRTARITGWKCGVRSCGYVLGVGFEHERVAVEIDGWAFHRSADRMARDAKRQNRLVAAGWTVLRFTYHRLLGEPEAVIAEVRRALGR